MSDMDTPEIPATEPTAAPAVDTPPAAEPAVEAPVTGPEAPEVPADAPEAGQVTPEPTPNPEPAEIQAELRAEAQALLALANQAVPVLARTASSESETQQPESAPEVEAEPVSLEDAARVLLVYVKAHRTAGDADLEAAVADVEAALTAQA